MSESKRNSLPKSKKDRGSTDNISLCSSNSQTETRSIKSNKSRTSTGNQSSTNGKSPSSKSSRNGKNGSKRNSEGKAYTANGKRSSGYSNKPQPNEPAVQPGVSHDRVRKIVQEEGRSARNLIAYNVPANEPTKSNSTVNKLLRSPRKASDSGPAQKRLDDTSSVRSGGSRPASSMGSKRTDMRSRYWAFLFDNLKRAVDEIYQTCESDQSVDECKEVIMILEQCTKDFQSLINQWNVMKTYEHLEESGQRPVALAWEVRKTSPGKLHLSRDPSCPSPSQLFSPGASAFAPPIQPPQSNTQSWADKVKGTMVNASEIEAEMLKSLSQSLASETIPSSNTSVNTTVHLDSVSEPLNVDLGDSVEGWETVKRQRSKVSPSSKASNSSRGSSKKSRPNTAEKQRRNQPIRGAATTGRRNPINKNENTNKIRPATSQPLLVVKKPVAKTASAPTINSTTKSPEHSPTVAIKINTNQLYVETGSVGDPSSSQTDGQHIKPGGQQVKLEGQVKPLVICLPEDSCDEDEEVLAMQLEVEDISESIPDPELQEQDAAILSAEQEERTYLKEIERTEREEMPPADLDTDEDLEMSNNSKHSSQILQESLEDQVRLGDSATSSNWDAIMARYEAEMERRKRLSLTWADIDEQESRTPGRGAHMHEKLSSPSRKVRSVDQTKKKYEEKQAKAAELRARFRREKYEKLLNLTSKVEEVRDIKNTLIEQKKIYINKKLNEAEEKRQKQLKIKVKKAHEEENKANEIAFINTLSEQNKKMDILTKHQDVVARLQDRQEERQRKIDEKAAKDAAVEERRKALDAERLARLEEMQTKRRIREEKIEKMNFEKDKERSEALKAKEREHKDRRAELERQQQVHIEKLQKKIVHKQTEGTRRHKEALQIIREKAFIINVLKHSTEDHSEAPKLEPYDTKKMCTVCNMLIPSEVHLQSHLRGQNHQKMLTKLQSKDGVEISKDDIESFNLEHLQDVPGDYIDVKQEQAKERAKTLKKRSKKLKQRMTARGNEFEANLNLRQETIDSTHKAKLNKIVKDVNKFIQSQEKGPWPQNKISVLDRVLGEVCRIFEKKVPMNKDQLAFRISGGISAYICLLKLLQEEQVIRQYHKTFTAACQGIRLACKSCFENCHYLLFSNKMGNLIDLLTTRLQLMVVDIDPVSDTQTGTIDSSSLSTLSLDKTIKIDISATALIHTLSTVLSCLATANPQMKSTDKTSDRPGTDAFQSRVMDVISYMISVGVVDNLHEFYNHVRGSVEQDTNLFPFLQYSINLLTSMTKHIPKKNAGVFESAVHDPTPLMQTLEDIELAGTMSLLYGMLLHNVACRDDTSLPTELSNSTLTVALAGLKLINQVSTMDYKLVQRVVGQEGISLEWRHIISHLIWYCTHYTQSELLHEVILAIGYFTVLNSDNQYVVQSGQSPTILQQLCNLPFSYFSDPTLVSILYPTLIACCYQSDHNKLILEQELSAELLAHFLEESTLVLEEKSQTSTAAHPVTVSDGRVSLAQRFPQSLWMRAQEYFSNPSS